MKFPLFVHYSAKSVFLLVLITTILFILLHINVFIVFKSFNYQKGVKPWRQKAMKYEINPSSSAAVPVKCYCCQSKTINIVTAIKIKISNHGKEKSVRRRQKIRQFREIFKESYI